MWIEGQSRQRYRLVILSVSSGQSLGSVTSFLERSWTLFFAGVSRWRVGLLVELLIQKEQCCFCPASGLLDQLYTLARVPEGAWEFAQPVYMCFVDLDKAYDLCPPGCTVGVLQDYEVDGLLLLAQSLLSEPELGSHCRQ